MKHTSEIVMSKLLSAKRLFLIASATCHHENFSSQYYATILINLYTCSYL